MAPRYPKAIRTSINRLLDLSFDRELGERLANLREPFDSWEKHDIGSGELLEYLEAVHDDAKFVLRLYRDMKPEEMVARAIVQGILEKSEVPVETREALSDMIERFSR